MERNRMKNKSPIVIAVVVVVALAAIFLMRGGEEPRAVEEFQQVEAAKPVEVPAEPVELSPVEFETLEVFDPIEVDEEEAEAAEAVAAVRAKLEAAGA